MNIVFKGGFKNEEKAAADTKTGKVHIQEDRLPTNARHDTPDPIADAFKLKG